MIAIPPPASKRIAHKRDPLRVLAAQIRRLEARVKWLEDQQKGKK